MIDWKCSHCWFCGSDVVRFDWNPTIFKCSNYECERLARGCSGGWMKLYFEGDIVLWLWNDIPQSNWRLEGPQNPEHIYEDRERLLAGEGIEGYWNLTDMKVLEEQIRYCLLFL